MAVGRSADYANSIPDLWSADLYMQADKQTFFHRLEGEPGSGMPVIRVDDLTKEPGDSIKTDIALKLTGSGQTGDTSLLEGNEEKLIIRQASFSVDSLQHAVRWSKKAHVLITHNLRDLAKDELARWYAGQVDNRIFNELTGQTGFSTIPTKNKWAAGTATSRATVADTATGGRLTLDDISRAKAYFQTEIQGEPIKLEDGQEIFGMVIHPYSALNVKLDDTKWAQAQREAQMRGQDNPLFTGALGMWDGVVLYESSRVPRSLNGNTPDIMVADNVFFGANAITRGWAYYPDWTEQEFSYGQEHGIASWGILGQRTNIFDLNATETTGDATDDTAIGSLVVYSAAVSPTQP